MRAASSMQVFFSGIDGVTGAYPRAPLEGARARKRRSGVMVDVDARDLSASGWAVVFGPDAGPEVRQALAPLLELRRSQAGALYRETSFAAGDDVARTFMDRHEVAPGPVDPTCFPYYVLIVGSAESVPFEFQYRLSYPYAVGRLHFETPEEYAHYARSVVAAESAAPAASGRAAIFAPCHADDMPTTHARQDLARPLGDDVARRRPGWRVESYLDGDATRSRLGRLLGAEAPQILFTAGHGVRYGKDHELQPRLQGALVCNEWGGPQHGGPRREALFAGDDVAPDADLSATIAFLVACYSAGTPRRDNFERLQNGAPKELCSRPFTAHLAQRLLGRPRGALAVVGHVDQAMLSSFFWPGVGSHVQTFTSALVRLMDGQRVGAAMWSFAQYRGELLNDSALEDESAAPQARADRSLRLAYNDARGYVVLGDPAVRINVTSSSAPQQRKLRGGASRGRS